MTSRIRHITIDCHDPWSLAVFWSTALGFVDDSDNPNAPGDPEALLVDPKGLHPGLLFLPVGEPKATKNRVHLDLVPDLLRDQEVDRLLGLGATLIDDRRGADGAGWAVLATPRATSSASSAAPPSGPSQPPSTPVSGRCHRPTTATSAPCSRRCSSGTAPVCSPRWPG